METCISCLGSRRLSLVSASRSRGYSPRSRMGPRKALTEEAISSSVTRNRDLARASAAAFWAALMTVLVTVATMTTRSFGGSPVLSSMLSANSKAANPRGVMGGRSITASGYQGWRWMKSHIMLATRRRSPRQSPEG